MLVCCCALHADTLPASEGAVTLDPAAFAEVWNGVEVRQGRSLVLFPEQTPVPGVWKHWDAAMRCEEDSLFYVHMVLWLQEMNPAVPMGTRERQYAAAAKLHLMARAGQRESCMLLEKAYREGSLPCGLRVPRTETVAQWWAQRAHLPVYSEK